MARVVVIGAGLAGLVAARHLVHAGHEVVALDKGRSPGGRLATRRIAGAVVDHGAQFFTVRSEEFAAMAERWIRDGLVTEWCRGFAGRVDGYPRYKVAGGMNALAKHLATGLEVRCSTLAFAMRRVGRGWVVVDDTAAELAADAVIITTPSPQAISFLISAGIVTPGDVRAIAYEPTLALLAVLDGPSAVPEPGGVQEPDDMFAFVADNQAKGISAVPALTCHLRGPLSSAWWDEDPAVVTQRLIELAAPYTGSAEIVEAQLKRWRYATPTSIWPEPCLVACEEPPLVLAGDAFAGARMEGAARSGLAAAVQVGRLLPHP